MEGVRWNDMKFFDVNMTAHDVRKRLYELIGEHQAAEKDIPDILKEHKLMCKITVAQEMKLAADGWMTE